MVSVGEEKYFVDSKSDLYSFFKSPFLLQI